MLNVSSDYLDLHVALPEIEEFSSQYYDKTDDLHGLNHIQRVLIHAKKIWKIEGGNWDLIEAIIWLHDIGRAKEDEIPENHANLSKQMAHPFLQKLNLSPDVIISIMHGIEAHSFSLNIPAKSIEAKIVSDADKIDALGAIGIFRVSAYQARFKHGIEGVIAHCHQKIFRLQSLLFLETSKKMGRNRTLIIKQYISELQKELSL